MNLYLPEKAGSRILVLGTGGGCDILSAQAICEALQLRRPDLVFLLGNTISPRKGMSKCTTLDVKSGQLLCVNHHQPLEPENTGYYGTLRLEQSVFDVDQPLRGPYLFVVPHQTKGKVEDILQAFGQYVTEALSHLQVDMVISVDNGGDSLTGGVDFKEDKRLGRDMQMMDALRKHESVHIVMGPGCDGESTVEQLNQAKRDHAVQAYPIPTSILTKLTIDARFLQANRTPNIITQASTPDGVGSIVRHGRIQQIPLTLLRSMWIINSSTSTNLKQKDVIFEDHYLYMRQDRFGSLRLEVKKSGSERLWALISLAFKKHTKTMIHVVLKQSTSEQCELLNTLAQKYPSRFILDGLEYGRVSRTPLRYLCAHILHPSMKQDLCPLKATSIQGVQVLITNPQRDIFMYIDETNKDGKLYRKVVSGAVEPFETIVEAALAELQEEVGLSLNLDQVEMYIMGFYVHAQARPGGIADHFKTLLFVLSEEEFTLARETKLVPQESEGIKTVGWVTLKQIQAEWGKKQTLWSKRVLKDIMWAADCSHGTKLQAHQRVECRF